MCGQASVFVGGGASQECNTFCEAAYIEITLFPFNLLMLISLVHPISIPTLIKLWSFFGNISEYQFCVIAFINTSAPLCIARVMGLV